MKKGYMIASISALVLLMCVGVFWGNGSLGVGSKDIMLEVRFPRVLLAVLVGASLAGSGAIMQLAFRNVLVDPFLLGISSGAAFGCALSIWLFDSSMLSVLAFIGSFGAIVCVMCIAHICGKSTTALILSGVVLSAFFSALSGYIKFFVEPQKAQAIVIWLLGNLNTAQWSDVWVASIGFVVGFVPLWLMRWKLNVFALSDEQALSFGVSIRRFRLFVLFCISFAIALCVSVSGVIGWIGLVMPHIARAIFGSDMRVLLPGSLVLGAIALLVADSIARNIASFDIPVGIITAILGAPCFLFLLIRLGYVKS
ncbi:iron ABC transporter permease [Helicobacter fennelliae]|uniref:Iron(III) dicitrate ABC transporter, permease protein fecD n=1 Tax=Helicobacter fennelliae MRY12-0050 TaxID=1325130 RepID=T1CPV8_9HELI|nr:iron ABC transporter permease [Helicobacter fennelliae]GAD18799.1 iron(III) dicitrate ABC transporter, permease protein fecD [Helicobacter fennelliae MRY12-0050]STP07038.1 iron(III) ABC transporter permease [Helicobacter fennelliae]